MIGKMAGAWIGAKIAKRSGGADLSTAALLGASAVALIPLVVLLGAAAGTHAFKQGRHRG